MKEHKAVTALLRAAERECRCAYGSDRAQRMALKRRECAGELISPYRGLYSAQTYWHNLGTEQRSLHVIRALACKHPQWVFAELSAVCLYGLQHANALHDGTVCIASSGGVGGHDEPRLRRFYMNRVPKRTCKGIFVTSPERTLIDCAERPFVQALAIYDSALRIGLTTVNAIGSAAVQAVCDQQAVSRLLRYADSRSENGGESLMRGIMIDQDFAVPLLQREFENPYNRSMPYRADFCWKLADGRIIVAEYDGMAKYADVSNPNRASFQAKMEYERRREQDLKSQGVTVIVHVVFEELMSPSKLENKLINAGVPKIR
ncbi:hypothetical protein JS536_01625 [Bifidobacterium sp. SO4]|nr:hypothetical protein [Bifidobacterium sp. SO4]